MHEWTDGWMNINDWNKAVGREKGVKGELGKRGGGGGGL